MARSRKHARDVISARWRYCPHSQGNHGSPKRNFWSPNNFQKFRFPYPSRSPDLTAPDFFLWGYLKERVYANKPRTIEQLKENIRNEIIILNQQILAGAMQNALKRARMYQAENGSHFKNLIFKN
ncbi:unnamed protein product [Psylliodes chrysocephalus]|uniref:Uncharacterized protein n=1 Tax=Psylliodes chrysocephalus TaxID=3402493 RepID=A0A9P0CX94_9CUCU|nr:unnamed protein product [Psylliodes chrysocephala]